MRNLFIVVVLVLACIAGVGFYRGWFNLSSSNGDRTPSATLTMDKDKIHADEQAAKDKMQGLGQATKEKINDLNGKPKDSASQP
jgi:hypothetical protein